MARTGYLRNVAYPLALIFADITSVFVGYITIALWQAVAPETSAGDPYTRSVMTGMVVLAQSISWITVYLPSGLGVHVGIRTGAIALDLVRPVPFFPMVLAREMGSVAYQGLYRCVPIALIYACTVGFPRPASAAALLMSLPSLAMAIFMGLALSYTVGVSGFWTTEIRWAQWTYFSLASLLSGGWLPADILPGWLGQVAPYLPFATMHYWPIRLYLGMAGAEALLIQAAWVGVMILWCQWATHRGFRQIVVQGG